MRVAHEHLRVVARGERLVVAGLRHHELVPDVAGRAREQQARSASSTRGSQYQDTGNCVVALTQMSGRGEVRHRPTLS